MVTLYPLDKAAGLQPLFDKNIPNSPCLFATIEKRMPAQIFVNNATHPKSCAIFQESKYLFTSQDCDLAFLGEVLAALKPQHRVFLVCSLAEADRFKESLPVCQEIPRWEFKKKPGPIFLPRKASLNPAAKETIEKIDTSLFLKCEARQEILNAYLTDERFLANGLGYCLIKNGEVISEAYGVGFGAGQAEIMYRTKLAYRGLGYASVVCQALIRDCEARGYQCYLSCNQDNPASISVARKLGFGSQAPYLFLQFEKLSQAPAPPSEVIVNEKNPLANKFALTPAKNVSRINLFRFQIISGSMSPLLKCQDILLAAKVSPDDLRCGDIIVFRQKNLLIAHRFIGPAENSRVITKGDNAAEWDPPLPAENIVAKVIAVEKKTVRIQLELPLPAILNFLVGKMYSWQRKIPHRLAGFPFAFLARRLLALWDTALSRQKDNYKEKTCLLALSQLDASDTSLESLFPYFADDFDWKYFYSLILFNNVGPIIHENLKKIAEIRTPSWFLKNLGHIAEDCRRKNSSVFEDIGQLLARLSQKDVDVIGLKGIVLAPTLYNNIGLRPMEDVDLLIRLKDWPVIKKILDEKGFENENNLDQLKLIQRSGIPLNWHVTFKNPRGTKLEFKFHLFDLDFPEFFSPENYWLSAKPLLIAGQTVLGLALEDHIAYLASRMRNVSFRHLLWFNELEFILRRPTPIDWDSLTAKACQKNINTSLYYVFSYINQQEPGLIPPIVLLGLEPTRWKKALFFLAFGVNDMSFRKPFSSTGSEATKNLYLFLSKAKCNGKTLILLMKYVWQALFPPPSYLAYRYQIPYWQAAIGIGHLKRMGSFLRKQIRKGDKD